MENHNHDHFSALSSPNDCFRPAICLLPGIRLIAALIVLILLPVLAGCTKMVPREDLPYPLTNESFPEQVKVVTVPLPVIATSPNEGITAGGLAAFLLHNKQDEVSTLIAPQVNYNKNFGTTGSLYGALYPEPGHSWEMNISRSQHVNQDYEVRYIDRHFFESVELNAFVFYFTDGSARFFGFQSTSRKEDETNYGDHELGVTITAAYPVGSAVQLVVGERVRKVNITEGAVKNIPFIRDDGFNPETVPGINGFTTHAQKVGVQYSTLDSPTFPIRGLYGRFSVEFSSEELGSSDNYRHYEAEIKSYIPLREDRFITVMRAAYNQTLGSNVPFLERSILGGETTLRGYGRNRFIDSSYLLINLEERIRLFRWKVFNVNADWELAPFLDLGTVAKSLLRTRTKNLEFNPGIGFRATVRPNIVGRVDVGFGNEGAAVFVGLGYPF